MVLASCRASVRSMVDDIVLPDELTHGIGHQLQGMVGVRPTARLQVDDADVPVGKLNEQVERPGVADGQVEDLLLGGDDVAPTRRQPVVELEQEGLGVRVGHD